MKRFLFLGFTLLLALALPFATLAADPTPTPLAPAANANAVTEAAAISAPVQWVALGLACLIVVGALVLIVPVAVVLFKQWQKKMTADPSPGTTTVSDEFFRSRLAWLLTTGALIFIGVIATIVLFCAGLNALLPPQTTAKTTLFFDIVKYVLTALLPVVAGWVGTVLAFYFGKANFEAATKSAKEMATVLSSKDKLAATPVRLMGKAKADIALHQLGTNDPNVAKAVKLDVIEQSFTKGSVSYQRLPVLFANDVPYLVLHRSILDAFLREKAKQTPTTTPPTPPKGAKDYSLADLFADQTWLPDKSFVAVGLNATAAEAREKMEQLKGCTDVLVTNDGSPQTAMVRWFTNLDLLKAAEV